ncbi:MAG TPA: alpha-L-arabinofuranosidase C-terminal domain-containing protein [Tepidisphaeraceae bacterium]|nr:alpha-L-arabinofuranosidase C-terminal domain-containing protein [Tepidisphaeraceae bacterium]
MAAARILVYPDVPQSIIRPELYGHFAEHLGSCIDEGLWVGEDSSVPNFGGIRTDVLDALRQLHPPVLRWPGGCFADDYHWEDGVGPRPARPRRVNLWWGQNVESNAFGTHEFIQVCRTLGAEPYIGANVGSGSPREVRDWVEYCNFAGDSSLAKRRAANGSPVPFGVRYWGIGNEAWGCGGNFGPEAYADEYKRFATYVREYSGTRPFVIACGPDGNHPDWTRRFFAELKLPEWRGFWAPPLSGFAAHYYCGTAGPSATEFNVDQWYELLEKALRMENLIHEQRALIDQFDPDRKIGLLVDEWGTWHLPTPGRNPALLWQQSTLRDGLVAALTLDVFNRNSDKLVMANLAQAVNVLQSLILTEGDKMITTPTYHVFEMYRSHQGGRSLQCSFEAPTISFAAGDEKRQLPGLIGSASLKSDLLTLSVVNPHASLPTEAALDFGGHSLRETMISVLTHADLTAHNTFDAPDTLRPQHHPWEATDRHLFAPASVTVIRGRLG